jgi:hypothetical protein
MVFDLQGYWNFASITQKGIWFSWRQNEEVNDFPEQPPLQKGGCSGIFKKQKAITI